MGLGPLTSIYQARFMKYLNNREILDTHDRKVWCFVGDGEMDEPESLAGLSIASRENLDNLVFVLTVTFKDLMVQLEVMDQLFKNWRDYLRSRLECYKSIMGSIGTYCLLETKKI